MYKLLCFIRSLPHDADAVHIFVSKVLSNVKIQLPNLKMCFYFSGAGQYKD